MIRGVEAVALEEASPCSISGSIVVGTGGYLTEKLEMSADCSSLLGGMHGPQEASKQYGYSRQAKSPALVAVLAWNRTPMACCECR